MKLTGLLCLLFAAIFSVLLVQTAEAKLVYRLDGRQCSKAEYNGAELAEQGHKLLDAGRLDEAADRLRKAATLAPKLSYIQSNLAFVLVKLGRAEEAIPYLMAAAKLQKGSADAVRALSSAYVSTGNLSDAVSLLEEFAQKHSDDAATAEMGTYCVQLRKELTAQSKVDAASRGKSENNYLAFTTAEEGSVRWESNRLPLKVYVVPANGVRGYRPEFSSQMEQAFHSWEEASNNKLRFLPVTTREGADITLTWTDDVHKLDSPDEGGEARVKFGSKGVTHSDIFILTHNDITGRENTTDQVYGVCLHEIGHSLGLLNHSPNAHDVMFFSDRNAVERPELSGRDKNTLKLLYETAQAYVPRQGSTEAIACEKVELFNGAIDDYNSARYDEAVRKCERVIKIEPGFAKATRLMADALDNSAATLMEKQDYASAEPYAKRALNVRRTLGAAADVHDTLYNYGIILRALHKDADAEKVELEASTARVISTR